MDRRIPSALLAFLAGEIVIYLFGVAWQRFPWNPAGNVGGLLPFLIGDAIKLVAAGFVTPAGWALVK